MNIRLVFSLIGKLLLIEGGLMMPSLAVAVFFRGGDVWAFVATIALTLLIGGVMARAARPRVQELRAREGFIIVALAWIFLSLFGALPYVLSGAIPHIVDAFFESVSGFTTTGASILTDIESLPKGVLFWRSFTHWIGGMGVLVFTLAITPKITGRTSHLMRAESPGPTMSKLLPRMGDTAKLLYVIYFVLSLLLLICLLLAGMNFYDACIHTFSTAGTGGFSNMNASVGAFGSPLIEWIIAVFMVIFGVNFAVYFRIAIDGWRKGTRDEELRVFLGIVLTAMAVITLNILPGYGGNIAKALRDAVFQVASVVSTTGFMTADFAAWPALSQALIVVLMFIGSCAGSTAGGLKVIRVLLLGKNMMREITRSFQPRRVQVVKLDGKVVAEETLNQVGIFFFAYLVLLLAGTVLVCADGVSFTTGFTAALTTLSNVGPGLDGVGPTQNFAGFSTPVKLVLSFLMLCGRLEIFPMLVLFNPRAWEARHVRR